ncbi:MAG: phosphatase PAP2 family protein [Gammaproteobacteria bacterium]|nr:MAG: phosphatase PAP2 family protein [Gammaproteobacteria bacterium]
MVVDQSRFIRQHFLYPLVVLAIVSAVILIFGLDVRIADYFYGLQGYSWAWKNAWLTDRILHRGGRALSIFLAASVLISFFLSYIMQRLKNFRQQLLYLFLSVTGSTLLVVFLKMLLAVSCPWEFDRYGGRLVYANIVQQLHLRNGGGCFPAGHASAGYAWVALYFFGLFFQSRLRWLGLLGALTSGFIFGFAQQLRGAHFISHDLWALAICWFFSLGLYLIFSGSFSKPFYHPNAVLPLVKIKSGWF